MKSALLSLALLALSAIGVGEIALYRGGRGAVKIRTLKNGGCLPDDYITIHCTFPKWPGHVNFKVNGKYVRTETRPPYTIGGDVGGYAYAWKPPRTHRVTITCIPQHGRKQVVTVFSMCAKKIPVRQPKKPKKPKAQRFSRSVWNPKPWKKPVVKPRSKPMKRPRYMPKRHPIHGIEQKNCVVLPYYKVGELTKGWKYINPQKGKKPGAVAYKPYDKYPGVFPGNTALIRFKFKVPVRGHYAVTLDMTTGHYTEHNDCWLKFEGGFTLRRGRHKMRRKHGFLKAYHNKYGRSTEAYSVDFDPHSFSTTMELVPWKTYTMIIGGRSTQLFVHRIIMFPCEGWDCEANTKHWKDYVRTCSPLWP